MFENSQRYHRVPVGFGPAPSPRQDPTGERFDWSTAETSTAGVLVECDREAVQAILPDGYTVEPPSTTPSDKANVLFEVMELRKLPWLAGRGYNTWGVYICDVVCQRTKREDGSLYKASYMAVLFESFTDPITTGREELGFSKLWAELPDGKVDEVDGRSRTYTASWLGFEFMRMKLSGLKDHDPATAPTKTRQVDGSTHPTQHGILHHRYVPAVGAPGKADASYATFNPPPPSPPKVLQFEAPFESPQPYLSSEGGEGAGESLVCLKITRGGFQDLPTLHNVVDGLANLKPGKVLEAAFQKMQGASDLINNHRIEY